MSDKLKNERVPEPTIRRLPAYCRVIKKFHRDGYKWISATDIASELDLKPIQVRKDMSIAGAEGKPKLGFPTKELWETIRSFLNWNKSQKAVLIGAGALGTALLGYSGFSTLGLDISKVFDINENLIGTVIHNNKILNLEDLEKELKDEKIEVAIITTPADSAQKVADMLVKNNIKGIWNFAPTKLKLPKDVIVEQEDLSAGFAILSAKLNLSSSAII